jgi:mannosylglycerate hydrolase
LKAYSQDDILLGIFNPTAHECRQVIRIAVDVPTEESPRRLSALDTDGNCLAVQPIAHFSHQAPVCVENSRALPYYADRHFVYLDTGKIPAYGYKIVKVVPVDQYKKNLLFWHPTYEYGSQLCGPNKMANRYLEVEIHPDGTFTLKSIVTGQEFSKCGFYEDSGDIGDYWQRVRPEYDKVYHSTSFPANIYVKEDGPLVTTFVCEQTLKLPAFAQKPSRFNNSRSGELAEVKICTELKLKANNPFLEVEVTVTNDVRDHRLRVGIPTFIAAEVSAAMGHFNVDSRPIVRNYESGIRDGEMGTMPMQHFVDISDGSKGVAILCDTLSEFEVSEDHSRTVYLTLLRCMETNISTEGRCATVDSAAHGSQCPGKNTFRYAVFPHRGSWRQAHVYDVMEQFVLAPKVYQVSRHDHGSLPQRLSLFAMDNKNMQVSAIKRSEDGDGVVVRLYNPTESSQTGNLKIAGAVKQVWITNMNEEKQEKLSYKDGVTVSLTQCEIKTILFCTGSD